MRQNSDGFTSYFSRITYFRPPSYWSTHSASFSRRRTQECSRRRRSQFSATPGNDTPLCASFACRRRALPALDFLTAVGDFMRNLGLGLISSAFRALSVALLCIGQMRTSCRTDRYDIVEHMFFLSTSEQEVAGRSRAKLASGIHLSKCLNMRVRTRTNGRWQVFFGRWQGIFIEAEKEQQLDWSGYHQLNLYMSFLNHDSA